MIHDRRPNIHLVLLAALLLAAFALRLFRLDYQSLWWDEGISLHLATSSWAEIIRDRLDNIHPPLYFFLLKGWLALTGVSPFTGRYLSVLASLAQVALAFTAARHWSGRPHRAALPWVAAALMLLSPLSVIYGQEIRVYAMLPLIYIGGLLLAGRLLRAGGMRTWLLFCLVVLEWIGLHLHYVAILGVGYITLWGLWVLLRRHDRAGTRRWIGAQTIVAVASLPWLLAVLNNWAAVSAEAGAGTFGTEPVPLRYLFAQVWAFHLTGLAGSLGDGFVRAVAAAVALLMLGLIALTLLRARRQPTGQGVPLLLAHWLMPLMPSLFIWSVRSFSHPRYIIMFAAILIPLVATLAVSARGRIARSLSLGLLGGVLALSVWGLNQYFFNPAMAKPDIRGVAAYLKDVAVAGDMALAPDTDWSLPFEYNGVAPVAMPQLSSASSAAGDHLTQLLDCSGALPCATSGLVYALEYPRGMRDWQNRVPFELERRGHQTGRIPFNGVDLLEYQLSERPGPLPACGAADPAVSPVRFTALQLDSVWIEQGVAANTAVAVALCWSVTGEIADAQTASLLLRDPVTGERIAQVDTPLLNRAGAETDRWRTGDVATTYHLIPLPAGTPPIELDLALGVYPSAGDPMALLEGVDAGGNPVGRLIPIGAVSLAPSVMSAMPQLPAATPSLASPIDLGHGLELAGFSFAPGPYRPGQAVRVGLMWRATAAARPDLRPSLRLAGDGVLLARNDDAPVNGRYPTDRWQQGELVYEVRELRIPPGVDGDVQLEIALDDGSPALLGAVAVSGAMVLFDRPDYRAAIDVAFENGIVLLGYDPPQTTVTPDQPVALTLYWGSSSGAIPRDYTVFVHLVGQDGTIIAQQDSPPANGSRPTDEWLAGEYIVDPHELTWGKTGYRGAAQLIVGLYDPATGRRLQTTAGADHVELATTLTVK